MQSDKSVICRLKIFRKSNNFGTIYFITIAIRNEREYEITDTNSVCILISDITNLTKHISQRLCVRKGKPVKIFSTESPTCVYVPENGQIFYSEYTTTLA